MNALLQLSAIVTLTVFIGCSKPNDNTPAVVQSSVADANSIELTEDDVLAIAKRELEVQDTWADRATFEVERDGNEWRVFVQRHPIVLGGHRFITIDNDGNVTDYMRGL
ncbi:hypothetical protein Poly51_59280 [Rubripirellula tenax]|uniref:Uncharacterized protein n=1 Tax=Rubripirellula tenax TaxID=2528015 RepID=A0A5C6EBY8_9BACT|nr:hypothetical protein [Rubripirellula tenax]TWU44659.1 hypothetical protein Poly51_59280 [Rubripirellula tenax]